MIMPSKAMNPNKATKPKGLLNSNKVRATPEMPNGAVSTTKNALELLRN